MNLGKMGHRPHATGKVRCAICRKSYPRTHGNRKTCGDECAAQQRRAVREAWKKQYQPRDREHPWCAAFDFLYPLAKAGLKWETLPVPYSQFGPKFVQSVRLGVQIRLEKA